MSIHLGLGTILGHDQRSGTDLTPIILLDLGTDHRSGVKKIWQHIGTNSTAQLVSSPTDTTENQLKTKRDILVRYLDKRGKIKLKCLMQK